MYAPVWCQAMEAAASNGPPVAVLEAILLSIDDRNAGVSAKVGVGVEEGSGFGLVVSL